MSNTLVDQPTALPSRKVFLGALAGIVTAAAQAWATDLAASIPAFAWLSGDAASAALPILVGYGVSYLVRDRGLANPNP